MGPPSAPRITATAGGCCRYGRSWAFGLTTASSRTTASTRCWLPGRWSAATATRPGTLPIKDEDHPHQISVRWDNVAPKPVEKYGWQRTLVELSKEDFDALSEAPVAEPNKPARPQSPPAPCLPRNVIVYGPPGTGKTYSTVRRALELILGPEALQDMRDEKLLPLFRDHQARGRIEFVTFHQAYGYEEFVEGIRPVLDQAVDAQVRYEIHDGVFKRHRPACSGRRSPNGRDCARIRRVVEPVVARPAPGRDTHRQEPERQDLSAVIE